MCRLNQQLIAKREALLRTLADCGRVAVAFSAGVDSTVVAKAAQIACGENAIAVTAVSGSLAAGEKEQADGTVNVNDRDGRVIGDMNLETFIAASREEIETKGRSCVAGSK